MKRLILLFSILVFFSSTLPAQSRNNSEAKTPTINEKVAGMEKFPGYSSVSCPHAGQRVAPGRSFMSQLGQELLGTCLHLRR